MKKLLLISALTLSSVFLAPSLRAQSAMFTYSGIPAGPIMPGSSFMVSVSLVFTSGGAINNVNGLSYWMAQTNPTSSFPFSITLRDVGSSTFNQLQSPGLTYPQVLNPISRNSDGSTNGTDLGALSQNSMMSGTYPVATLTFALAPGASPGTYTIQNTTSTTPGVAGRTSVINNSVGTTFPIAASSFQVTVVPEPSTFALLGVAGIGLAVLLYRRRASAV